MIMTYIFTCILFVLMCGTSRASLTATLTTGYHSYPANGVIKYSKFLCNDPCYNNATGIYTVCPGMAGCYLVSVTMMSGQVMAHTTLRKNGGIYVWLFTGNSWDMATQTVCMKLEVADQIWIQMQNSASYLFDVYNTFNVVKIPTFPSTAPGTVA
ncbi:uncharacterized protein LOC134726773 [Mytilus trossulus]|uniref:uncharacterized protein LOC134726773 n=1 Tax=Mytilus trossulus TaxID=6551 RepID=UPI003006F28F